MKRDAPESEEFAEIVPVARIRVLKRMFWCTLVEKDQAQQKKQSSVKILFRNLIEDRLP